MSELLFPPQPEPEPWLCWCWPGWQSWLHGLLRHVLLTSTEGLPTHNTRPGTEQFLQILQEIFFQLRAWNRHTQLQEETTGVGRHGLRWLLPQQLHSFSDQSWRQKYGRWCRRSRKLSELANISEGSELYVWWWRWYRSKINHLTQKRYPGISSVKSDNGFLTRKTKIVNVFNLRFLAYCFLFMGFLAIGKKWH